MMMTMITNELTAKHHRAEWHNNSGTQLTQQNLKTANRCKTKKKIDSSFEISSIVVDSSVSNLNDWKFPSSKVPHVPEDLNESWRVLASTEDWHRIKTLTRSHSQFKSRWWIAIIGDKTIKESRQKSFEMCLTWSNLVMSINRQRIRKKKTKNPQKKQTEGIHKNPQILTSSTSLTGRRQRLKLLQNWIDPNNPTHSFNTSKSTKVHPTNFIKNLS